MRDDPLCVSNQVIDGFAYIKNSEIYQVEDRIFRVAQDTKIILEIFK